MFRFVNEAVAQNIVISVAITAAILFGRWAAEWVLKKRTEGVAQRRRRFAVRASANALLAICLLSIWMSQIQSVMLSLTAVAIALVVATKELIMCIAGAALRIGGHLFKIGDRIEVNGLRGEVIDHGLLSTTLMELPCQSLGSSGTGRTFVLPNSVFLTGPVRVEPQPRQFAPHRFAVTLDNPCDPGDAVRRMQAAAGKVLAGDAERAARFHRLTAARAAAEVAGPGHEVSIATSDLGKLKLNVMLYCLVQEARRLEQEAILQFLSETHRAQKQADDARRDDAKWDDVAARVRGTPRQNAA